MREWDEIEPGAQAIEVGERHLRERSRHTGNIPLP
jgi:hypothetical protein